MKGPLAGAPVSLKECIGIKVLSSMTNSLQEYVLQHKFALTKLPTAYHRQNSQCLFLILCCIDALWISLGDGLFMSNQSVPL